MTNGRLEGAFPKLKGTPYSVESPVDSAYNCIAYAAGDTGRWWWPLDPLPAGWYWPLADSEGRQCTLRAFERAFALEGYERCQSAEAEERYEKVVIYTDSLGAPKHAARQLDDGRWVSKLGRDVDIFHETPEALEGHDYGRPALYMKRPRH